MRSRSATVVPSGTDDSVRLSDGVFMVAEDGVARLLDFERGRFYALDAVGSVLLTAALKLGMDGAACHGAERFAVPLARVRADLTKLRRDLEQQRLLARGSHDTSAPRGPGPLARLVRRRRWRGDPRLPSRGAIAAHLMLGWASLRLLGWLRTLQLWRRLHRPAETGATLAPDQLDVLDRRLRSVAARLILPMNCKERALVLHQILRARYGVPATLVVGIQRHPFAAHAWVECGGQVLTDDAARCATFTAVARYG